MNNEIPTLWLWISGLFFLFGILVFGATLVVLFKILKMAEEMKPKIESLTTKVEGLTVKLDKVADRVEETMTSVKESVDGVGSRTQGILGSLETVTKGVTGKLEGITPILAGAMAAYKIFLTIKAARQHSKAAPSKKALPAKKK